MYVKSNAETRKINNKMQEKQVSLYGDSNSMGNAQRILILPCKQIL